MPSNKDLEASINEAAETLGVDAPDVSDANNAQRAEILKEMNAEIEAAKAEKERLELKELEAQAEEDSAAAALLAKKQAEAKKAEAEKLPEYYVPVGKAITTRRGILSDNSEITAKDLAGGKEALDAFVTSGHVAKG